MCLLVTTDDDGHAIIASTAILCLPVYTMDQVGIRELRQEVSKVLKRVVGGETIEVTDHGHPIARIVPLRSGALDQMILEGRAMAAEGDLLDIADGLGLPAARSALVSDALAQLRADER